MAGVER